MPEFEYTDKSTGFSLRGVALGEHLEIVIDNNQTIASKMFNKEQVSELINDLIVWLDDEEYV